MLSRIATAVWLGSVQSSRFLNWLMSLVGETLFGAVDELIVL